MIEKSELESVLNYLKGLPLEGPVQMTVQVHHASEDSMAVLQWAGGRLQAALVRSGAADYARDEVVYARGGIVVKAWRTRGITDREWGTLELAMREGTAQDLGGGLYQVEVDHG